MLARIRYIAALSEQPQQLAGFYQRFLQMQEIARSHDGDVSLSDGFCNFTLIKKRPGLMEPRTELGLHHIGLEVASLEEVKRRYLEFNPRGIVVPEPGGPHHGELRIYDPECNPVSLSQTGFGIKGEARKLPGVRHVAWNALDPDALLKFYTEVLGLRELSSSQLRRREGRGNRFAGDGFTNLAIHPFYNEREGHEPRFGVNHIGFLVADLKATMDDLASVVAVKSRPADRPFAEFRFQDPEGNPIDLSQHRGWEVDLNKWERVA